MSKEVIFTVCARNYLAQALTLKQSVRKANPETDFLIFIADYHTETGLEEGVMFLDDSWIPNWKDMAFKYNVIEFSTSIKPFCINYLFQKYEKVMYLDPDIYVVQSLNPIFESLDQKDVVITPHYCEIQEQFTGAVSEEEILFVGIYNLGFLAIRNSEVGKKVINWWMDRLRNKCYADKQDALHVDQKWFDFIPAFFPDNVLISHHFGINIAIWNLHERELRFHDQQYFVLNKVTQEEFPLLFFHFSGFNPLSPRVINRRHPNYNVDSFPTFGPLFEEYTAQVLANGFDRYSNIAYGFNTFSDREKITPLQRRLYREISSEIAIRDPFDAADSVYQIFKENKFLTGVKIYDSTDSNPNIRHSRNKEIEKGILFLKGLKKLIGIKYYNYLLVFFSEYHRPERQANLLDKRTLAKYAKN